MKRDRLVRDSVRRADAENTELAAAGVDLPTQIDIGDATDVGTSTKAARADHQHAFPGPPGAPPAVAAAGAAGVATTPARSDHTHAGVTSIDGAGGAFVTGSLFPASIDIGDGAVLGTAGTAARADHQHALVGGGAPPAIAAASSAGAATSPARSDHTHQGVASVEGAAGAITIVSPMKSVAGGVITLANANSKNLPGGFVTNDIDTDVNTDFVVPKLAAGATTIPIPKAPTGNVMGRKVTFWITSRGTASDTVTWTGGAGGFSWATQLGPLQADFDALLAATPNDAVIELAVSWHVTLGKWVINALAGYFT